MRNPNAVQTVTQNIVVPSCETHLIALNVDTTNDDCTWTGPFEAEVRDTDLQSQVGKVSAGSPIRLEQGNYTIEYPEVCGMTVTVLTKIVNNSVEICNPYDINQRTDFEFVCNEDSGFYDRIERFYENGVLVNEVIIPTTYPCNEQPPDFEQVRVCIGGFIHIITNQIEFDGTINQIDDLTTQEVCDIPAAINTVKLDDVCANVDGLPMTVVPLVNIDTSANAVSSVLYVDIMGNHIIGTVVAANPCDCDCLTCADPIVPPVMQGFGVAAFVGSENTKFNLDDDGSTGSFNAYGDVGLDNWTAIDLVNALNANSSAAIPATIPSGVDYSSTVFAVSPSNPDFIIVISGPIPAILTLASLPAVIPLITI